MSIPKGLKYTDRIAPSPNGYWFVCHRRGHSKVAKRFDHESSAKEWRAAHDTALHNVQFAHVGFQPEEHCAIAELVKAWNAHVGQMEIEGIRSPQTSRYYDLIGRHLIDACRDVGIRTTREINPHRVSQIVRWMRANTATGGDLTRKALAALKTMMRWKGLPVNWQIPHDEIRARPREKKDVDAEMIRRVVAVMPDGSIEQACAYLKARTGAHDVEIYEAMPEEFDLDVTLDKAGQAVAIGVFRPMLRKKGGRTTNRRRKRHVYVLTSDAVEKVRPFVERARRGEYIFHDERGRPMSTESMRPKIRAASKRAGIVKTKHDLHRWQRDDGSWGEAEKTVQIGAIESLAQIRAEVLTIVEEEVGLDRAARFSGHDDPKTLERWYLKDRITARRLLERFTPAEIVAKAIPLSAGEVN